MTRFHMDTVNGQEVSFMIKESLPLDATEEERKGFSFRQTLNLAYEHFLHIRDDGSFAAEFEAPRTPKAIITIERTYLERRRLGSSRSALSLEAVRKTEDGTAVAFTGLTIRADHTIRWDEGTLPDVFLEYRQPLSEDSKIFLLESMAREAVRHQPYGARYT